MVFKKKLPLETTFKIYRAQTGSEMTRNALGPNSNFQTPPNLMNLERKDLFLECKMEGPIVKETEERFVRHQI